MTIYVDKFEITSRKRKTKKFQEFIEKSEAVEDLGVDYIVIGEERGYVIERKTVPDLLNSVFHSKAKSAGRLYDQLNRVKDTTKEISEREGIQVVPILVVEGSIFTYNKIAEKTGRRQVPLKVYRGILLSVIEGGVFIIETRNFSDTIDLILHLDERAGKKKKLSGLNVKKRLRSEKEEALHMLYAVTGVGEKKASSLLEKYGSVKNIVNLKKETLVKELGPKIGAHFYTIVTKDFSKSKKIDSDITKS